MTETRPNQLETYKVIQGHYAEMGNRYANLSVTDQSWTTTEASGSCAYVFVYLNCDCYLQFGDGTKVSFSGKGMVVGLGATGTLGGQATFNVDPKTLKGMQNVTFEAAGIGVVAGGFQVTWYQNHKFIGHGEFYGLGVQLGTPGGGWGTFS